MISAPAVDRSVGGVPASELVTTYGTPLLAFDLDAFELEIDHFRRAFVERGIVVGYAAKAFICTALAELLAATPLRLDVCSLGELLTAERGGFPAGRLYFHGAAKSDAELEAIVAHRVAFGVIDNREELARLAAIARPDDPIDVVLRINTGIEAHTHEFVRTGGEDTKFGIPLAEAEATLKTLAELPQLRTIGVHGHVGSQILEAAPFVANLRELLRFADRGRALGLPIREINVGGGIGIEEAPGEPRPLDLADHAAALAALGDGTPYQIAVEPGRALAARAGTSLYRVTAVKQQGRRRFVIVDGGLNDNPRPLLYGARHPAEVAVGPVGDEQPATLAGRSCENDEIGEYRLPSTLAAGDVVAMHFTGAYTYSMASNYNRFPRLPVVFVRDGTHRLVVRRETEEDVLRCDFA